VYARAGPTKDDTVKPIKWLKKLVFKGIIVSMISYPLYIEFCHSACSIVSFLVTRIEVFDNDVKFNNAEVIVSRTEGKDHNISDPWIDMRSCTICVKFATGKAGDGGGWGYGGEWGYGGDGGESETRGDGGGEKGSGDMGSLGTEGGGLDGEYSTISYTKSFIKDPWLYITNIEEAHNNPEVAVAALNKSALFNMDVNMPRQFTAI
jgi:hypothetical protein